MKCLIAVVGPTGVGKSSLGFSIAQRFNGEIINADSRQVYRHMDIGTAKPPLSELASLPHHLFDIIEPDEPYSLSQYHASALQAISGIQGRDKVPVLVGGSGQYAWSVIENWQIPGVPPDPEFRGRMAAIAGGKGVDYLYRQLTGIDPEGAKKMTPGNLRRIIRALEIFEKTGKKPSSLQTRTGHAFPILIIGLTCERVSLYDRINLRADHMIENGLVEEVRRLVETGYTADLPSMSSLGYRQVNGYLSGRLALDGAVQEIKWETHRFARGQYAWFRLNDTRIQWFDTADAVEEKINYTIGSFLKL